MPYLQSVNEDDLRRMAKKATSLHLSEGLTLGDAVVKVASGFGQPLTTEHVRRVCEMSYHDTFERSFKQASGGARVVSFDPADAEKVAEAVQAKFIESHQDKLGSAGRSEGLMQEKTAYSPGFQIPDAPNAFSMAMSSFQDNDEVSHLEKVAELRQGKEDMQEAVKEMSARVGSTKLAELHAYRELGQAVRQEVSEGNEPWDVLACCTSFLKKANISEDIIESVIGDLASDMVEGGVEFTKKASLDFYPNTDHPLARKVVKVGELRGSKISGEIALDHLKHAQAVVEQELRNVLFS